MKKLFTFLTALFLASATFAQQGPTGSIPNAGFENWQTKTGFGMTGPYTYDMPRDWKLGFASEYISLFMKPSIGKAPNSLAGTFALKLSSTPDTIGADLEATFPLGPNNRPDGFTGQFQTSGVVTDMDDYGQALVFMTKWNGTKRDTIGFGMGELSSSPGAFSPFSTPIQYMNSSMPDTAIIYLLYFPDEANTHVLVDNLSFIYLLGTKKETASASQLKLFPNPVTEKATLTFNAQKAGKGTLIIRDMVGKEVKKLPVADVNAGANTIPVQTADLKKGIYTITLQTEKETQTLRFLKQ
ncbi:T9SS type A sorting domain-containing protein [Adhaeribacter soli]|uniref:T9SS type A sorting domain-containing protein n=1 Tax=Adhaeribacter soli TaxID=2607655 RepID=A0A5N1J2H2_9BACT|nr:T9SS type A sorting domain-containing protein [Adhaeribacter soli]KAA9339966.1 T9SS type A sorting domain-containing protein [Adhaeribacter soli]